jgi:hypothetical protein
MIQNSDVCHSKKHDCGSSKQLTDLREPDYFHKSMFTHLHHRHHHHAHRVAAGSV